MKSNRVGSLAAEILRILKSRSPDKTMCPSEALEEAEKQDKRRMEEVRDAAIGLAEAGKIEIVQRGKKVDPRTFRGPIRLRLKK